MNPTLPPLAQEVLNAFGHIVGWEQRTRLLLQWGECLIPLAEQERGEEHRVHGCESLVWLIGERRNSAAWWFRADIDARLIRGLLAVLLARVNGMVSATKS